MPRRMERPLTDEELWDAFTASVLPEPIWTHRSHLRMAWLFLRRHSLDEAHILLRVGIIRLNVFHTLVETPSRGYHETLTRVWLSLVAAEMAAFDAPTSEAFVEARLPALGKDAVMRHYSPELVGSVRARAAFVAPDRAPLPAPHARG